MVLDHGDHGVREGLLVIGEAGVDVLLEALGELLHDDGRVRDLLAVQLDER